MLNSVKSRPALAGGKKLIYIMTIFIAITSCNKKPASNKLSPDLINNPASASGENKSDQPVFEWTETRFDFGDVKQGEKVTHTFSFKY